MTYVWEQDMSIENREQQVDQLLRGIYRMCVNRDDCRDCPFHITKCTFGEPRPSTWFDEETIGNKFSPNYLKFTDKDIVITAKSDGSILHLKDVADIELGQADYGYSGRVNGQPSVQFMAFQLAGANAKETNDRFSAKLKELEKDLPKGLHFVQMMSSNDFLLESIANVEETLIIAIILVILVVYFFLQDFKATLIPSTSRLWVPLQPCKWLALPSICLHSLHWY